MKKIIILITSVAFLLITDQSFAKDRGSLFYSDHSQMNQVENILTKTAISEVTEALSIGHLDFSVLKELTIGDSFYLSLPDNKSEVHLKVDSISNPMDDVITYSGKVEGFEHSRFIVSRQAEEVLGSIKFGGLVYILEPTTADDNRHVIHQMNVDLLKRGDETDVITDTTGPTTILSTNPNLIFEQKTNNTTSNISKANGGIRVLFLYANNVSQADLTASLIVSEFNSILRDSMVSSNNFIQSAGRAQKVNSNFQNRTRKEIVNRMADATDVFNDIELRMRSVSADVAFLITESNINNPTGGGARLFNRNEPVAMSVKSYALGDLTAVHELGHVFGGAHALPLGPDEVDSPDSRGHGVEDIGGNWQTIMGGYTQGCTFDFSTGADGQPCTRIGYFSNPALAIGNAQTADMESVLESLMPQVSNWGSSQPVNYSGAVRGFSYDPLKDGHGIHITKNGRYYYLYFYTYDSSGQPEWFFGRSTFVNNRLQGSLSRFTFNGPGDLDSTIVGNFKLDYSLTAVNNLRACDGVNRLSQPGVFSWTINGQSGTWCKQPLFNDKRNKTPLTPLAGSGLWYEPAYSGWGLSVQVQIESFGIKQRRSVFSVAYYYDRNGRPRWAAADNSFSFLQNIYDFSNLMHFTGYPRNGTGTASFQDIGRLQLNLDDDKATIFAKYPQSPGGTWSRFNAQVARLAQ